MVRVVTLIPSLLFDLGLRWTLTTFVLKPERISAAISQGQSSVVYPIKGIVLDKLKELKSSLENPRSQKSPFYLPKRVQLQLEALFKNVLAVFDIQGKSSNQLSLKGAVAAAERPSFLISEISDQGIHFAVERLGGLASEVLDKLPSLLHQTLVKANEACAPSPPTAKQEEQVAQPAKRNNKTETHQIDIQLKEELQQLLILGIKKTLQESLTTKSKNLQGTVNEFVKEFKEHIQAFSKAIRTSIKNSNWENLQISLHNLTEPLLDIYNKTKPSIDNQTMKLIEEDFQDLLNRLEDLIKLLLDIENLFQGKSSQESVLAQLASLETSLRDLKIDEAGSRTNFLHSGYFTTLLQVYPEEVKKKLYELHVKLTELSNLKEPKTKRLSLQNKELKEEEFSQKKAAYGKNKSTLTEEINKLIKTLQEEIGKGKKQLQESNKTSIEQIEKVKPKIKLLLKQLAKWTDGLKPFKVSPSNPIFSLVASWLSPVVEKVAVNRVTHYFNQLLLFAEDHPYHLKAVTARIMAAYVYYRPR